MPGRDPAEYGRTWAAVYDDVHDLEADTAAAISALTGLLHAGSRILDLGTGTGRLSIPLAGAGMHVVGLDASSEMIDRLTAKPGGNAVSTLVGDMLDPPVDGPFDAILITFNTLFALEQQDDQISCLTACSRLLAPDGRLFLDMAVPQAWRQQPEQPDDGVLGARMTGGRVAMEVGDHDPITQTIRSATVLISETAGVRTLPLRIRYIHPSELDLMARIAGLQLLSRNAGWDDAPFDRSSTRHISVYRPLPTDPSQDLR